MLFYDVDEDAARGEATIGRRRFAFDCSLPPVADYEVNKTQEEEEVCLDERLVQFWLQRRVLYGQYEKLVAELREEDAWGYKNYMRISPELFQELLERVGPRLEKGGTFMRKTLRHEHRLAIALRYMASGDCYKSLSYSFRVAHNTISNDDSDMLRICCGCVTASTVIYGFLRSLTVDYGEMKFLNMLKIAPRKKQNGGSATVDAGTSRKITVMSTDLSLIHI